ncbi:Protein of unknown function (DUF506 [Striga hermonthica]|uniref:Uncharacterized protein n=1 Tax=Striga hermonthica TaxID=68872 RepID=A0A9N7R3M1_STRHE|nr:Protein of unknown function (DUF506 [Striga hermonthica]
MQLKHTVVNQLCTKGFNAALCKSKWQRIHNIPGGTHEYIEVLVSTKSRSKHVKFVVELGFQDEFKMAKACDEYNKLTDQLPEIYIGKTEHMNAVIRVVCDAAKKSAKERKIHLGPWRKRDFMEMKWRESKETKPFKEAGFLSVKWSGSLLLNTGILSYFIFHTSS